MTRSITIKHYIDNDAAVEDLRNIIDCQSIQDQVLDEYMNGYRKEKLISALKSVKDRLDSPLRFKSSEEAAKAIDASNNPDYEAVKEDIKALVNEILMDQIPNVLFIAFRRQMAQHRKSTLRQMAIQS